MKLITKELKALLPEIYAQEDKQDNAIAYIRLVAPWNNWQWYITEYCPKDRLCFGLIIGPYTEIGYFSIAELESVQHTVGLQIERDASFTPTTIKEIKRGLSC